MLTAKRLNQLFMHSADDGYLRWRVSRHGVRIGSLAGRLDSRGHRQISVDGKRYAAHRLVWLLHFGPWLQHVIDHINGLRDDNRLSNLRDVLPAVNAQNIRKPYACNKSTGVQGVTINPRSSVRPFRASVVLMGKRFHLGGFATANEAHEAYLRGKRALHPGCTI